MAVAIFGKKVLEESSVTGMVSNRVKKNKDSIPKPKLDPQRILAIKGIFSILILFFKTYETYEIYVSNTYCDNFFLQIYCVTGWRRRNMIQ